MSTPHDMPTSKRHSRPSISVLAPRVCSASAKLCQSPALQLCSSQNGMMMWNAGLKPAHARASTQADAVIMCMSKRSKYTRMQYDFLHSVKLNWLHQNGMVDS